MKLGRRAVSEVVAATAMAAAVAAGAIPGLGGPGTARADQAGKSPRFGSASRAAQAAAAAQAPIDLRRAAREMRERIEGPGFTAATCAPILREIYQQAYGLSVRAVDLASVRADPAGVIRELWQGRLALRHAIAELKRTQLVLPACEAAARDVLRAARFAEDFVGDWRRDPARPPAPVLGGSGTDLLTNPAAGAAGAVEIRSGDVLLSRGDAFTSAAIARLGMPPAQFSHLALAYKDPADGRMYTVEAHIEIGAVVEPLDKYLGDGKVRALVFRHRDPALAHRAARIMAERVRAATRAGANVPYDFAMNASDPKELYCAEVVSEGFRLASEGRVKVPAFPSRLNARNRAFLDRLGIHGSRSFTPGDLELDPEFELLHEWRDFSRIRQTDRRDAVLSKMYEWMAERGDELPGSLRSWFAGYVLLPIRKVPWVGNALASRFPTNMPRSTLMTILQVEDAARFLEEALAEEDRRLAADRQGVPMTAREMDEALEGFRRAGRVPDGTSLARYLAPGG